MKNSFATLFILLLSFSLYGKIRFITMESLNQNDISGHEAHCGYYAFHNSVESLDFLMKPEVQDMTVAQRAEKLNEILLSRELFARRCSLVEDIVSRERALLGVKSCVPTDPLGMLFSLEINSKIIPEILASERVKLQLSCIDCRSYRDIDLAQLDLFKQSLRLFRAGLPVSYILNVPVGLTFSDVSRGAGVISPVNHFISLTLYRGKDGVLEVYFADSAPLREMPEGVKSELIKFARFVESFPLDIFIECCRLKAGCVLDRIIHREGGITLDEKIKALNREICTLRDMSLTKEFSDWFLRDTCYVNKKFEEACYLERKREVLLPLDSFNGKTKQLSLKRFRSSDAADSVASGAGSSLREDRLFDSSLAAAASGSAPSEVSDGRPIFCSEKSFLCRLITEAPSVVSLRS